MWIFLSLIVLSLYWAVLKWRLHRRRQQFITSTGCKPIATRYPVKPSLLGLDFIIDNVRSSKVHMYLEHSRNRFQRYGNTWTTQVLCNTMIQTIEPENMKAIFATNTNDWVLGRYRTETFRALLGSGIFTLDGEDWKHSRVMLGPAFKKSQTADLSVYETHIENLYNQLPKDGQTPIDIQQLFFKLTMDSATEILFGKSLNTLVPEADSADAARGFATAYESAKWDVFKNVQLYPLGQFRDLREMKKNIKTVHAYVDQYVEMAKASRIDDKQEKTKGKGYNFLQELAKSTDDTEKIRSELLSLLLAGRDTTAALLSNVVWVLARRQDILVKLRAEVEQLNGKKPTYDILKAMKYLDWLLKESLRLHNVVPVNTRTACRDTMLPVGGGPDGKAPVFIPKGTQVVTSLYALHRRTDIYGPTAEEFKPERWEHLRPRWGYLPFLGGPRICPGQNLAMTQAAYTITRILQLFKNIQAVGDEEWQEDLAITCCNLHGTRVILTPSSSAFH